MRSRPGSFRAFRLPRAQSADQTSQHIAQTRPYLVSFVDDISSMWNEKRKKVKRKNPPAITIVVQLLLSITRIPRWEMPAQWRLKRPCPDTHLIVIVRVDYRVSHIAAPQRCCAEIAQTKKNSNGRLLT